MGLPSCKILEWVAISFSRGTSQLRDWTHISCISCIAGEIFTTEPSVIQPFIFMFNICWVKSKGMCTDLEKGKGRSEMAPQGYDAWCSGKSENELVGKKHSGQEERLLQRHGEARSPGSREWRDPPLNSESTGGRSRRRLVGMEIGKSIRKMAGNGSPGGERMLQGPEGELWVTPSS